jgi:hypothetical protein
MGDPLTVWYFQDWVGEVAAIYRNKAVARTAFLMYLTERLYEVPNSKRSVRHDPSAWGEIMGTMTLYQVELREGSFTGESPEPLCCWNGDLCHVFLGTDKELCYEALQKVKDTVMAEAVKLVRLMG